MYDTHLDLALSLEIEHRDRVHLPHTIGGGTGGEEKVTIRVDDTLVLEPSPASGMVGYGTVLRACEEHMTFVVCIDKHTAPVQTKRANLSSCTATDH